MWEAWLENGVVGWYCRRPRACLQSVSRAVPGRMGSTANPGFGVRHGQILLLFIGMTLAYSLRVNLSVGIVAMTDSSANPDFPELDWSVAERGTLLGSFFWGYVITQIPASLMAARFGPSKVFSVAMVMNGLTTLLVPLAAIYGGFAVTCACRVLQGLGQGTVFPCTNALLSKWVVPTERGRLTAFTYGGSQFGTILMLIGGGLLAGGPGGWPSIFYISGGVTIGFGVIAFIYLADTPDRHKLISQKEKDFIESNLSHSSKATKKVNPPWAKMACSLPLMAICVTHMAQNWGFWTLLTLMPTYMKGVLHFNIKQNGFLSSLPYLSMWISCFIFSFLADWLVKKNILTVSFSRRFWNSVSMYIGGLALILLAFLHTDAKGAVALLVVTMSVNAGSYLGFMSNHIDLSPNFAGTLMAITNCLGNIISILGPSVAGIIVTDISHENEWQIVFLVSALIYIAGNTVFIVFSSTEIQEWNTIKDDDDTKERP